MPTGGSIAQILMKTSAADYDMAWSDGVYIQNRSSSDTSDQLVKNTFFIYPEMATLIVTCPNDGICGFRFTSGSTATELTINGAVMSDGFIVEANKIYEINILNGYGVYTSWSVSS